MFSTAVPVAARANHGAATVSTKASATSFRQTNELHSGCSTLAMRPTTIHLAAMVIAPATAPATSRITPLNRAANQNPTAPTKTEEHTSELQSLMRISYAVFCLKKKQIQHN